MDFLEKHINLYHIDAKLKCSVYFVYISNQTMFQIKNIKIYVKTIDLVILNRPGGARVGLHTYLSFSHSLTDSLVLFLQILKTPSLQNSIGSRSEVFRECLPPSMYHMSHVTCYMSHVISHVICQVTYVTHIFFCFVFWIK